MWRQAFRAALKYLIQHKQLERGGGYHWQGLPRGARRTDWTSVRREAGGCFGKGGGGAGAHGWGRNKKPQGRGQPGKIVKIDEWIWSATLVVAVFVYAVSWASLSLLLRPDPSTLSQQTQTHLSWSPGVSAWGKDEVMVVRKSSSTQPVETQTRLCHAPPAPTLRSALP